MQADVADFYDDDYMADRAREREIENRIAQAIEDDREFAKEKL